MRLYQASDEVYRALKSSESLKDCYIIKAYPCAVKPTRLKRTVITVSPAVGEFESEALGGGEYYGGFYVKTDIFIPFSFGSPVKSEVTDGVIKALCMLKPSQIKAGEFKSDDNLSALHAECEIRLFGEYS